MPLLCSTQYQSFVLVHSVILLYPGEKKRDTNVVWYNFLHSAHTGTLIIDAEKVSAFAPTVK
jgi:hypothetical protein